MALPTGCPRSPARLGRLTPFPNGFRLSTGLRRAGAAPGGAPHPTPLRCCCRCVWRRGFPAAMASQTWRGGGGYYTAARSCSLPVKRTPHGRGRRLPRSPPPGAPGRKLGSLRCQPGPRSAFGGGKETVRRSSRPGSPLRGCPPRLPPCSCGVLAQPFRLCPGPGGSRPGSRLPPFSLSLPGRTQALTGRGRPEPALFLRAGEGSVRAVTAPGVPREGDGARQVPASGAPGLRGPGLARRRLAAPLRHRRGGVPDGSAQTSLFSVLPPLRRAG